jgi:hypothetical protein
VSDPRVRVVFANGVWVRRWEVKIEVALHVSEEARSLTAEDRERLKDEVLGYAALIRVHECRFLQRVRLLDAADAWREEGCLDAAEWLSNVAGIARATSQKKLRVAHGMAFLPKVEAAYARGEISYSKVRAIVEAGVPESEEKLLELARACSGEDLTKYLGRFRRAVDGGVDEHAFRLQQRHLHMRELPHGLVRIDAIVLSEEAERVRAAIHAARKQAFTGSQPSVTTGAREVRATSPEAAAPAAPQPHSPAGKQASQGVMTPRQCFQPVDGLLAVVDSYLARPARAAVPLNTEVAVHVDVSALLEGKGGIHTRSGNLVFPETLRRLCCDATLQVIERSPSGEVLGAGKRVRTLPLPLRRALIARDHGRCQFPGCTNSIWVDAHHIRHWVDGGEHSLENLTLLCRRHHSFLHEGGCSLKHVESGELEFRSPRGRLIGPVPLSAKANEELAALLQEEGIVLPPRSLGDSKRPGMEVLWATGELDRYLGFDDVVAANRRRAGAESSSAATEAQAAAPVSVDEAPARAPVG